jgi:hypothetical protein
VTSGGRERYLARLVTDYRAWLTEGAQGMDPLEALDAAWECEHGQLPGHCDACCGSSRQVPREQEKETRATPPLLEIIAPRPPRVPVTRRCVGFGCRRQVSANRKWCSEDCRVVTRFVRRQVERAAA